MQSIACCTMQDIRNDAEHDAKTLKYKQFTCPGLMMCITGNPPWGTVNARPTHLQVCHLTWLCHWSVHKDKVILQLCNELLYHFLPPPWTISLTPPLKHLTPSASLLSGLSHHINPKSADNYHLAYAIILKLIPWHLPNPCITACI